MIEKYVPQAKIEYTGVGSDVRDYRVSFDKIKQSLGFSTSKTIEDGIKETLNLIDSRIITDFENKDYYND